MRIGVAALLIVVAGLAAAVAVAASPATAPLTTRTIVFGDPITLTGKSPVADKVPFANVLGRPCQITQFTDVGRPAVAADGTFVFKTAPTLNTVYRVLIADREVLNLNVLVKPAITISRVNGSRFHVAVTTGNGAGLGGKTIMLQQKSGTSWRTVGSVKLKLTSSPSEVDAVAEGTGRADLRGAGAVRAFLPLAVAKPCFTASSSGPAH